MSEKIDKIDTGMVIERLTIGDLTPWVRDHPLFEETPLSYLQQGRLRECLCLCGKLKLISEAALRTGRVRSCGCLRREIRADANRRGKSTQQIEQRKALLYRRRDLKRELQNEKFNLAHLKLIEPPARDENAIKQSAARIRYLLSQLL